MWVELLITRQEGSQSKRREISAIYMAVSRFGSVSTATSRRVPVSWMDSPRFALVSSAFLGFLGFLGFSWQWPKLCETNSPLHSKKKFEVTFWFALKIHKKKHHKTLYFNSTSSIRSIFFICKHHFSLCRKRNAITYHSMLHSQTWGDHRAMLAWHRNYFTVLARAYEYANV